MDFAANFGRACWTSAAVMAILGLAGAAHGQCDSQKLLANDRASLDYFGTSISGSMVNTSPAAAIGARWNNTAGGTAAGSVYTFQKVGNQWGQLSQVIADDGAANDYFGTSVGYADPYIVAGAPGNGTGGAGYIFERFGSTWTQKTKIPGAAGDDCGRAVAVTASSGGWALVSAPLRDVDLSPNSGMSDPDAGVVFVCQRQANGTWSVVETWPQRFSVNSGFSANEQFGAAVSIAGSVAACGAPFGNSINWPDNHGYVRVYRRDAANAWTPEEWLTSNTAQQDDHYGAAVSTDGTSIAIGAPDDDATAAQLPDIGSAKSNNGSVYIQRYTGGNWVLDGQIFASDATNNARFGSSVMISGDKLVVGAAGVNKTYVFKRVGSAQWVQIAQYGDPDTSASGSFGDAATIVGDQVVVTDEHDDDNGLNGQGAAYVWAMPGANTPSDLCGAATAIQSGEYDGCTTNAGQDSITTCGYEGTNGYGPDVWYSWTPNCTGNVIIDTFGSSFDTVLSIHSACPGNGGSSTLVCNDDGFTLPNRASLVTFNYVAGTKYMIRVSGFNGAKGDFHLRVNEYQHPANDNCSSAARAYNGANEFKTCKASIDGPLDNTGCSNDDNQGADVWFKYTATSTGACTVNTCGANFDTVLMVYTVQCPTFNSQSIACSDDSSLCGALSYQSSVNFNATAGSTYTIRLGGFWSPLATDPKVGEGNLNVVPACPCDFNGNGLSVQDIFDFINAWMAGSSAADFNGDGLQVQDIFDYLNCWFAGCA